ncbi:universal stress protein [Streptomyces olivochromogenes]|uniref:universal stress protein n=1 Tax=Streptomyces olivochromogenes TaxID=1963 RepID=UPI001F3DFBB3|nr:universal stress protein [Streptomyces olivochromogenes]MCF3132357.1 universal stress protein [Streptomyces olivochromogenes]
MTADHVVVGVDGSVVSVQALDWAAEEAARRGAGLRVLYAVPDRDEAAPVLGSAAARVCARHPGLPVESVAAECGAVRALARASERAALTVVGTRGLGRLSGAVFGSVGRRLAAHARGPLAVVRGDHPCGGGAARDVLLGLEGDTDGRAAAYAVQEAERRGGRLCVLHPVTRLVLARLREQHPYVALESRAVPVRPPNALLDATGAAAVVVIGSRRPAGRSGRRPGPVARSLLHRARCPVVVVPAT